MNTHGMISNAAIRERATDLLERHHRPEGFEIQFWHMAHRELEAERATIRINAGHRDERAKLRAS